MFKKLTEFSYKRNWKGAIGFYLAYLLLGFILGGIFGILSTIQSGATTPSEGFDAGFKIGAIISIIYPLTISFIVLVQRKLHKNFGWVILALLSGLLAAFGGSLLGLLIPAFMTTRGATATETQPV